MAITNPKLFGLNVLSFLSDVQDRNTSLVSLNLPPLDLDVIRGSQNAGATRGDWISLSRLTNPLYKTLDRFYYDSQLYSSILDSKAGTNRTLFGNIVLNGALSGNAIRYRYLDGTGPSATVKIADISTSRVSAWSSSASPVLDTSPISYGARVGIITGGLLQFSTQSPSVSGPRLQTTLVPQAKEFDSEFPTHKIMCNIDGRTISLYAMKGIPVVFTGFFRNLDANIQLTSLINNTPASWKIVDTDNANSFTRFPNQGSTIRYRSAISKERYIQFYYNPDNVSSVTINSANISSIPAVKFQNLTSFNLASNSIANFPDLTFVTPSLQNLFLNQNPFYLSETSTERSLNSNIVSKIPTGLKNLTLGGTFYGSIPQNLISNRFTTLTTLNLSRSSGPYFHPDNDDANCTLPNVPNTCETYNVYGNDFRAFGTTSGSSYNVKDLTNLISLDLGGNYYLTDAGFSLSSSNTKIQYVSIYNTGLPCPDLSAKTSLTTFYAHYCRNIGSIFTGSNVYKFNGCSSLSTLYFYNSPLTGAMPKFTNTSLSYVELRYTSLTGGDISGDTSYVIPEKTFELSPNIQYFLLQSGNLLTTPIHPNAFSYTPNLYYLWYISYGRTTGNFPSLAACSNLTYLVLHYNNFSGNVPNFAANRNIYYADLSYNAFSGTIPAYKNLSGLTYLYLYNNQFTTLQKFENLPYLYYFYAHNNLISGQIPDFTGCPRLYYLILFNNRFTDYAPGAFAQIYNIRYIDISGNNLTQQAINAIISDLFTNYTAVNRRGVTINLRGNALPSGISLDRIEFLRSRGWSITYE
jgi:hypothetical protein